MPATCQAALQLRVQALPAPEAVNLSNAIPAENFRQWCRGAAALLLVVGHDSGVFEHSRTVPAKLFEYFGAGRPILVVGAQDSEAERMILRTKRGVSVRDDGPGAIAAAIRQRIDPQWVEANIDLTDQAVAEYRSEAVVGGLCGFFDQILGV